VEGGRRGKGGKVDDFLLDSVGDTWDGHLGVRGGEDHTSQKNILIKAITDSSIALHLRRGEEGRGRGRGSGRGGSYQSKEYSDRD
jgi:hypothetical protein